jgi:sodium-dependent phosphate cotransporter
MSESKQSPLTAEQVQQQMHKSTPADTVLKAVQIIGLLYIFLLGVGMLETSVKLLSGGMVSTLFEAATNPLIGLMIGMAVTALLQSSSTTTAIVVGLVASGIIGVPQGIPMVMGANIGTSVTNTLVSIGHAGDKDEFRRAFAGATVHDFFNILSVMVLLPVEIMTGLLQKTSAWLTGILVGGQATNFKSPFLYVLKPVVRAIIHVDKGKIKAASIGQKVDGSLLKGGIFKSTGMSDHAVGFAVLFIAILVTITALLMLVKVMKSLAEARASALLQKALEKNAYVAMGVGAGATLMVQSSSIITSTLVPMIGVGIVSLEAAFPLTLGANIGTTITALLASLGGGASSGLQIALCHLLFNIFGILVWYPFKPAREVPLRLARKLGEMVSVRRSIAFAYVALVFFIIPLGIIFISRALR